MSDKNPMKITQMFNEISKYYDKMNNIMSFGTHYFIKYLALKQLKLNKNMIILDVCCGTGDFTQILKKINPQLRIIGLDKSVEMVKLAKIKNPKSVFITGDCTDLIISDREFDIITVGFGLRNIQNRTKALEEIYRVLKPNGQFLHLDFGNHNIFSKIFDFFVPLFVNLNKANIASYKYLLQSKNEYPEPKEIIGEFEKIGFKLVRRKDFLFRAISVQIMQK